MDGMVEHAFSSGDFQHVSYCNGIWEIRAESWSDFGELLFGSLSIVVDSNDYFWRGQEAQWPLKSCLDRATPPVDDESRERQLKEFIHAMRGNGRPKPPFPAKSPTDIDRWWSIGQHYELATPFLDWTASPFIAAFFALAEIRKDGDPGERVVFALRKSFLDRHEAEIRAVDVYSDDNPRLIAQAGRFTKTNRTGESVEELIGRTTISESGMQLLEIILPESLKKPGLSALNQMNINYRTMFPDTIGAAKYCNSQLHIDDP
jgi:hypothetical protein